MWATVAVVGVVAILIGAVLMVDLANCGRRRTSAARRCRGPGRTTWCWSGSTAADEPVFRLPDSGLPGIVIAPDLSNLPRGERAVNPVTGDEVRPDDEP